ncbi:N-acetylmuramoyl-L-alanine amidase [Solicola gregarius]|uniref:N-acetylmuramoyl-L-alanine amidase n=1 Tax=Solicola gregarius TaxID=2908642 RepID=A0AA46TEY2_9ACTN|nr:N-acetylmuramoyl-L-alanine amidase [Solicola gregarius]UYM03985.1 N-acetylmuramoyl-L-alanine amidase [Solicola gregarius]
MSRLGTVMLGVLAAIAATLAPTGTNASPAARTTDGQHTQVDALHVPRAAGDRSADGQVARLAPTTTDDYAMVAVTWAADARVRGLQVRIRTRGSDGWSGWQHLEVDSDAPTGGAVAGTVPLWVGDADGVAVQVSADGRLPADVRVVTIDPAGVPASRAARLPSAGGPVGKPRFPRRPPIVTRKGWNADPDLGDKCFAPIYGKTTKAAFVHHTVGTNNYSPADSAAIVQGIQAYHTQGRGWCDIGYNFLVDRFGRIFEGRKGGMNRPVRGAHSGDFNTDSMGVSMMGNFDTARLSKRLKNAVVRLVGWRLGTNYVSPRGRTTMQGKRLNRISGHRDVMSTACPGKHGYAWLPRLRKRVGTYLSRFESGIRDSFARRRTGPVFIGERRLKGGRQTVFTRGRGYSTAKAGPHYVPRSPLLAGYRERGGPGGALGFPVSNYRKTKVSGLHRVATEKGRLFENRADKVYALTGAIERAYLRRGGVSGRLGTPRSDSVPTRRGAKARFANGSMHYDKRTKKVTVKVW